MSDLEIHMRKYSPFGLSFLKPFLVQKGANPVFYIARNSRALRFFAGMENDLTPERVVPRERLFAQNIRTQGTLFWKLLLGDPPLHNNGLLVQHPEEHQTLSTLQSFLNVYVFSFLKIFDDTTTDEDPENFYMEREWRVLGDINFELQDVYRVFLPRSYAGRFREDLPEYAGQVTFVDPS